MPEKLAPNVNSLTTIVVHLSEPIYVSWRISFSTCIIILFQFLVIILCTLASIVILRYLFKVGDVQRRNNE